MSAALPAPAAALEALWTRLAAVTRFETTIARGPGSLTGWEGVLRGTVAATVEPDGLHLRETGRFFPFAGAPVEVRNHLRWQRLPGALRLAHCRHVDPVELVDLAPAGPGQFLSEAAHLCGEDRYALAVHLTATAVTVDWTIRGPRKDERLQTRYEA